MSFEIIRGVFVSASENVIVFANFNLVSVNVDWAMLEVSLLVCHHNMRLTILQTNLVIAIDSNFSVGHGGNGLTFDKHAFMDFEMSTI